MLSAYVIREITSPPILILAAMRATLVVLCLTAGCMLFVGLTSAILLLVILQPMAIYATYKDKYFVNVLLAKYIECKNSNSKESKYYA